MSIVMERLREIATQNQQALRDAQDGVRTPLDNRSPAASGQPTRQPIQSQTRPTFKQLNDLAGQLPVGGYALRHREGDGISFFHVDELRGTHRIRLVTGAPGGFSKRGMNVHWQHRALTELLRDPKAAAELYADTLETCYMCHSPLTDALSRSRRVGPKCWNKRTF